MRILALFLMMMPFSLSAKTISETEGTFVFEGQTYRSVTRVFERRNGSTYTRRSIRVGSRNVTCSATDDRDCTLAIRDNSRRGL